ncbi:hypothetical protein CON64_23685 [Bacillus pseudomycoides]|nr:hypothetical protein CON64_23685 [Bacillus pseudomycoides]
MIYQYEIDFAVMYSNRITDIQSATVPAQSLEIAKEELIAEVKRRIGNCEILIFSADLQISEDQNIA